MYKRQGIEHVLCTWVHGLTALDDIIYIQLFKQGGESFPDGNTDKSVFLMLFGSFRSSFLLLLFFLLPGKLLGILDQLLLMFLTHVINLHAGKCTVGKRFLECLARMIGVYMYFHDFIICYQYNGITN